MKAHPVRLTLEHSGAGPGLGNVNQLQLREQENCLVLICECDQGGQFRIGSIVDRKNWRELIRKLLSREIAGLYREGDVQQGDCVWPEEIAVDGTTSLFTEIACLAWSGQPFSEFAGALIALEDEVLVDIRKALGPLTSRGLLWKLCRMERVLNEYDKNFFDLAEIISRARLAKIGIFEIWRGVRVRIELLEAQAQAEKRENAWRVFPYRPAIEEMVERWRGQNPASSGNTNLGRSMKSGALRDFLLRFVAIHRQLPNGVHNLKVKGMSPSFDVNFDDLKAD
jgi:hypothetical protein